MSVDQAVVFVVEVAGEERFRLLLEDPEKIAEAKRVMEAGRVGVVSGRLAAGDGGFNAPFHWHLAPSSVEFPDVAIELCDGRPSDVEADLDYWLNNVRRFCPWSAKIVAQDDEACEPRRFA
ncbi:MAG: hypothetical protein ACRD0K_07375 [Egibacteraceae bacterium]